MSPHHYQLPLPNRPQYASTPPQQSKIQDREDI
jgi:hypothetical protein